MLGIFCEASSGTTVGAHAFWKLFFSFWKLCFSKLFSLLKGLFKKLFILPDLSCQRVEIRQRFESIIDVLCQGGVVGLCNRCHLKSSSSKFACMISDVHD